MKYPKCQFEIPKVLNFCVECGHKLKIICPKCGFAKALSFKFCGECGDDLSSPAPLLPKALSFDEKLEKIQKHLPKGIIDKELSQCSKIEGEKKEVTVNLLVGSRLSQVQTGRYSPERIQTDDLVSQWI